jgi:hypothetical protein
MSTFPHSINTSRESMHRVRGFMQTAAYTAHGLRRPMHQSGPRVEGFLDTQVDSLRNAIPSTLRALLADAVV